MSETIEEAMRAYVMALRLGVVHEQPANQRPQPTELLTPVIDGEKLVWTVPARRTAVALCAEDGTVMEWLAYGPEWFEHEGTYTIDLRGAITSA